MQSPGQYGVNEVPQFLLGMRQHPPPHLFSLSHETVSLSPSSAHSHPGHQQHIYYHQQQQQQQQHHHLHHHQLQASHSPHQQHQDAQHQQLQQQQQMVQQLGLGGPPDSPEAAAAAAAPSPVVTRPLATSFSKQLSAVSARELVLAHEAPLLHIRTDDDGTEGGDDGRSTGSGNRWPRQETLVLIKIRSQMDASFRDSGLKGPLWEEVARRLAELGYNRSAKKCKEKFENIHKYYKKTKSGQAGRQDGKNYRFFSELDALYGDRNKSTQGTTVAAGDDEHDDHAAGAAAAAILLTQSGSDRDGLADHHVSLFRAVENITSTAADSDSSEEDNYDDHGDDPAQGRESDVDDESRSKKRFKRQHRLGGPTEQRSSSSTKVLFFESLVKKLMDKQDAMQRKFLESIERREQDRLVREEAWKRQEMAHLTRDHELRTQQYNLAVSRDAALVAALQKVTGQTLQLPPQLPPPSPPPPPRRTSLFPLIPNSVVSGQVLSQAVHHHHQTQHDQKQQLHGLRDEPEKDHEIHGSSFDRLHSKRWPTPEVHALIRLRSSMEPRFQETGPKGPLWEEISRGMSCLGYIRNAKRCKEKWENVNKYFRKIKESSKKRPENSKTCPYFHQLNTLYHNSTLGPSPSSCKPSSKVDDDQQLSDADLQLPDRHHRHQQASDDHGDNSLDEDPNGTGLVVQREAAAGIKPGMQQLQGPAAAAAGDGVAAGGASTTSNSAAIHFFSNTENGSNGDHGGGPVMKGIMAPTNR